MERPMRKIFYVDETLTRGFSVSLPEDILILIEDAAERCSYVPPNKIKKHAEFLLNLITALYPDTKPEDIELYLKVFELEYRRRRRNKLLMQKLSPDENE